MYDQNLQVQQLHHHYEAWLGKWGRHGQTLIVMMAMLGYSMACHSDKPIQWHDRWINCRSSHATHLASLSIQVVAFCLDHPYKHGVEIGAGRISPDKSHTMVARNTYNTWVCMPLISHSILVNGWVEISMEQGWGCLAEDGRGRHGQEWWCVVKF